MRVTINSLAAEPAYDLLKKHIDNNKDKDRIERKESSGAQAATGGPDPDPDDEWKKFKKKDGSERYECEKQESPQWRKLQNFKGEFKTNELKGKNKEYYRWDYRHKDIEIYDNNACYKGSKDPVTGKLYRKGDMAINKNLERVL